MASSITDIPEQSDNSNKRVYVLCSKYSQACKEFMRIVTEFKFNFIVPIFVDNQKYRTIILSSPLKIKYVPCIVGSKDGYIAIYEGKDAFAWLDEITKENQDIPTAPEYDHEAESISAHTSHKIDSKSIADQMKREREQYDKQFSKNQQQQNIYTR